MLENGEVYSQDLLLGRDLFIIPFNFNVHKLLVSLRELCSSGIPLVDVLRLGPDAMKNSDFVWIVATVIYLWGQLVIFSKCLINYYF